MAGRARRYGVTIISIVLLTSFQDERNSGPSIATDQPATARPEGAVVVEVIDASRQLERGGWGLVVRPPDDAAEIGGIDELVVVVAEDADSRCESGEPAHPSDIVGSSVLLPPINGVGLSNPPTVGVSEITALDC
jgi:hypothetical protein